MFVDDLKLYTSISSTANCLTLQNQINLLQEWCHRNRLFLNISKCKIVTYSRKHISLNFPYSINIILERTNIIKDLGVHFDYQVTFNYHF